LEAEASLTKYFTSLQVANWAVRIAEDVVIGALLQVLLHRDAE